MGIVYEAVHVDLDRPVALKVLNTNAAPDSSGRRRFLNEAKTAAGLHHTHIVPVFDVGQVGGLCYYAMQRIEGCGLDRVVKALRKGRSTAAGSSSGKPAHDLATLDLLDATSLGDPTRSWFTGASRVKQTHSPDRQEDAPPTFEPPRGSEYYKWVARAGVQAAEALAHAHRRGVIHRDVKPSNLLVDARGTVWVADFGLARRLADPSITQADSLLGTPRYMSPEQSEIGPIDGRTDVYSLGATLYELLTLRPPHDGRSAAELIGQIRNNEPAAPRKHDPRLPRDLETIVIKALAKRPSDRYADAGELAADLNRFLATEPVKARRIGPVGRAWRFARRHPSLTAVSTVAIIAILATATVSHVKVIAEKNKAIAAEKSAQQALKNEKIVRKELQSKTIEILYRDALASRHNHVPDLRKTGLARLKEAVALGPDSAMRAKLRDEAVEFLAIRDIEPRPPITTGKVGGLAFTPETGRLATLSADQADVSVWDITRGERLARHPLFENDGPDAPDPGARRGGWPPRAGSIAASSLFVAAILPGGEGVRLFDLNAIDRFVDLPMKGRKVVALYTTADGQRIVTVDQRLLHVDESSLRERGNRGGQGRDATPPGLPMEADRVSLWDPRREDPFLASLSDPAPKPDAAGATSPGRSGRPSFPVIACSPDGRIIATCNMGESTLSLWNADGGQKLGSVTTEVGISAIAIGKGGVLMAASSGLIHRWDANANTLRPLPSVNVHQSAGLILRISPSPDGGMLAVSGFSPGITIWDPEANSLLASLPTTEMVQDLAFSPDSHTLAASVDGATRVWAMVEPIGRTRIAAPEPRPSSSRLAFLGFGPSGALAFTFGNEKNISARLRCRDGAHTAREGLRTWALGFDPQGRLIIPNDDTLEIYRGPREFEPEIRVPLPVMPDVMILGRKPGPEYPHVTGAFSSTDRKTMVLLRLGDMVMVRFGESDGPSVEPLTFVGLNEPRRGADGRGRGSDRPRRPDDRTSNRPNSAPRTIALSPSCDRLYLIHEGLPHAWSIQKSLATELDWSKISVPPDIQRLAVSPDGGVLALGRASGQVMLIDSNSGAPLQTIPAPPEHDGIAALAYSSLGQLAVGHRSGTIRLWKATAGHPAESLVTLGGLLKGDSSRLAFSPDGTHLAAGDDSGVEDWNLDQVKTQLGAIGLGW